MVSPTNPTASQQLYPIGNHVVQTNPFEEQLARAKAGEFTPPDLRLALYICLKQSSKDILEDDLFEKSNPVSSFFVSKGNKERQEMTREEIAILYNEFLNRFACIDTSEIYWSIDYAPQGDLADIIRAGHGKIEEARKLVNGPKLPLGWGIGAKCFYTVTEGCAKFNDFVIGHDGRLLKENPWEVFYRTNSPADEKIAKELQPTTPFDIKLKMINREIVARLNYNFVEHAQDLSHAENWGVVGHLIEINQGKILSEVGFSVLYRASQVKKWTICQALFAAGLPAFEKNPQAVLPPFSKLFKNVMKIV